MASKYLPTTVSRLDRESRTPHNRVSPETESKIRDMLREGIAQRAIAQRLEISTNVVNRVAFEMRGRPMGTAAHAAKRCPTRCTGTLNCQCVYHLAEAYKRSNRKPARVGE